MGMEDLLFGKGEGHKNKKCRSIIKKKKPLKTVPAKERICVNFVSEISQGTFLSTGVEALQFSPVF